MFPAHREHDDERDDVWDPDERFIPDVESYSRNPKLLTRMLTNAERGTH